MEFDRSGLVQKPAHTFGIRHLQYLLCIMLIIFGYGMRVSFNVAIIAILSDKKNENYPTYPEWLPQKQLLLSSFFWGYLCCQLMAGYLGKKFGVKYPLFVAVSLTSIITICLPFMAKVGYQGALACRIMQGLTQGFIFPSVQTVLSLWAPLSERTKYGSIVWSGMSLGNLLAMPITGAISASPVGWPTTFYLYGGLGLCWCVVWLIFGDSSPETSRWIPDDEKKWIQDDLGDQQSKEEIATPWKSIFTSVPFYALLISHCGQNWGYWTMLTEIPTYMSSVLKYDISSNGLLSTLPYVTMFITNLIMGYIANLLIEKRVMSLELCRKLFNCFGHFVPAIALITLCLVGTESRNLVIFLLVAAVASNAGTNCGINLNHIDLAPVHAGILMGITNSTAAIFSILAPLSVGAIETVTGYKEEEEALWKIVFYITAGVFITVGNIFLIFGSTKVQPWNIAVTKDARMSSENRKPVDIQKKISVIYKLE